MNQIHYVSRSKIKDKAFSEKTKRHA